MPDNPIPDEGPAVRLRTTGNLDLMQNWALVLEALAVQHQTQPDVHGWGLWVAALDANRAEAALAAFDRDRREQREAAVPAAPDQGPSGAGLAFALVIAAFFYVTGGREDADLGAWFARGSAVADRIMAGQWWRTITALTLHADTGHVFSNAVAGLVFVTAVGRWMGGGTALLATLVAGAGGNLLVALAYRVDHNSVGASTATFAAVGLLVGLQIVRWLKGRGVFGRRRRAMAIFAAGLGVFAMLGVGKGTDVLAHLFGLVFGVGVGAVAGRFIRLPIRTSVDVVSGLVAAAVVAGAWLLAFK